MATQEAKRKAGDGPGDPSDSNGVDAKRQRLDGAAGESTELTFGFGKLEKGPAGPMTAGNVGRICRNGWGLAL